MLKGLDGDRLSDSITLIPFPLPLCFPIVYLSSHDLQQTLLMQLFLQNNSGRKVETNACFPSNLLLVYDGGLCRHGSQRTDDFGLKVESEKRGIGIDCLTDLHSFPLISITRSSSDIRVWKEKDRIPLCLQLLLQLGKGVAQSDLLP